MGLMVLDVDDPGEVDCRAHKDRAGDIAELNPTEGQAPSALADIASRKFTEAEDCPAARQALRWGMLPPDTAQQEPFCGRVARKRERRQVKRLTWQERSQLRRAAESLQWSHKAVECCESSVLRVCQQVGIDLRRFKKWMANNRPKVLPRSPALNPTSCHSVFCCPTKPTHLPLLHPSPLPMAPLIGSAYQRSTAGPSDLSPRGLPSPLAHAEAPQWGSLAGQSSLSPECIEENGRWVELIRTWVEERVEVAVKRLLAEGVGAVDGVAWGVSVRDQVIRDSEGVVERLLKGPHTSEGSPSTLEAHGQAAKPCHIGQATGASVRSHLKVCNGTFTGYLGTKHAKSQVQEVLFEHVLTAADTSFLGYIFLPPVAACRYFPAVEGDTDTLNIDVEDDSGGIWGFSYRFRGSGSSSTCVFENTRGFVERHQLSPGDTLVFCCTTTGHLLLDVRKQSPGLVLPVHAVESNAVLPDIPETPEWPMPETSLWQQGNSANLVCPLVVEEGVFGSDALVLDLETMRESLVDLPIVGSSVATLDCP